MIARNYQKRHHPNGGPLKRHVKPKGTKRPPRLAPDHPALVEGRTLFPHSVVSASVSPRLLISGHNSRKIGKAVTKGRWAGMPIFTLTLEERKHCPRSCGEWATCYGNNMNWARRHSGGPDLERKLEAELRVLQHGYPGGFVVRLHVLGDFYSVGYVAFWNRAMTMFPALRIFGFTAHDMISDIGAEVAELNVIYALRCRIRFSGSAAGGVGSVVIDSAADSQGGVICPVQLDRTDCCGTCGLCWTMQRTVEFIRH